MSEPHSQVGMVGKVFLYSVISAHVVQLFLLYGFGTYQGFLPDWNNSGTDAAFVKIWIQLTNYEH